MHFVLVTNNILLNSSSWTPNDTFFDEKIRHFSGINSQYIKKKEFQILNGW